MKGLELLGFLRVARGHESRRAWLGVRGTPSPCFLQEYDSIGVKRLGCAKNMILWELGEKLGGVRSTLRLCSGRAVDPSTPLPTFLRVNRASSLKLKGQTSREVNAEAQSARRA